MAVASRAVLLALLLALAAPTSGTVEIDGATHRALTAKPVEAQQGPWAERRSVVITPAADGLQIRARWQLRTITPGWFSGRLFGPTPGLRVVDARWNGQPAAIKVDEGGGTIAGRVSGPVEVVVEAFVPADPAREALTLQLLPAVRGTLEAGAPEGLAPAVTLGGAPSLRVGGAFRGGAEAVGLSYVTPPQPVEGRPPVVVAKVGIGLTVGDADLRGRARAVWEVRQGEIAAVEFLAAGTGADLDVKGANVRGWTRAGERVRVELQAPVRDRVELELTWTTPIGRAAESRASVPRIAPEGVFRSESALQLARDGEVEAVPATPGWSPVVAASLPAWAQGLVESTTTASLSGGTGGELSLLRFVPIEGPPVVVDVAAYTVATSREGRALVRAHLEVRNERAAHLKVRPPAGFKVIGIRVGGKAATPARAKDGAWIVPLLRSVETVRGLLSFPVEVILLGDSQAWHRRETRTLELPRFDAPVAVSRVTLHLPPGYRSRKKAGEGDVVAAFTRGEGITYGLGTGEVGAAQADATFQEAVQAWMRNDFGAAQGKLDELRGMGAKNENIERLQSNLDVVGGKASGGQDVSLQRRIREQAKARAYADVQAQAELKKKAEDERARGDYEAAASSYSQALAVGDKLAALEQDESVEQRATNSAIAQEIAAVEVVSKQSRKGRAPRKGKRVATRAPARDAGPRLSGTTSAESAYYRDELGGEDLRTEASKSGKVVYDFADDDIEGEMLRPEGAVAPSYDGDGAVDGVETKSLVNLPAATRDFSAVVDVAPGVGGGGGGSEGRAMGPQAAPPAEDPGTATTGATTPADQPLEARKIEAAFEIDARPEPAPAKALSRLAGVSRQTISRPRWRNRGGGGGDAAPTSAPPKPPEAPAAKDKDKANADNGMPTPVVHASALSVVVPAVGQAVRYQRLLLPPGAAYSIEIAAKEPLLAKE